MTTQHPCPACGKPLRVWHDLKSGTAEAECHNIGCDFSETGEGNTAEEAVTDLKHEHAAWVANGKPRRL